MQKTFQLDLNGEITIFYLQGYYDSLVDLLDAKMDIVISLREVHKIDIAGIQLLLCFYRSRQKRGLLTFIEYEGNQTVGRLFKAAGADQLLGSMQ